MVAEPLFPFLLTFLPAHSLGKKIVAIVLVGFHLGIPLTIGVPYANFALIITLFLFFEPEISAGASRAEREQEDDEDLESPSLAQKQVFATYLLVLFLAMQKNVPILKNTWEPAMGMLYLGGVAQEYHLFDWIDRFNWSVDHQVSPYRSRGGCPRDIE